MSTEQFDETLREARAKKLREMADELAADPDPRPIDAERIADMRARAARLDSAETPETLRAMAEDDDSAAVACRKAGKHEVAQAYKAHAARLRARAAELESAGKGEAHTQVAGPLFAVGFPEAADSLNFLARVKMEGSERTIAEVSHRTKKRCLGSARLLAAAYTSYDSACGPRAIEAAESDLLADALAALEKIVERIETADVKQSTKNANASFIDTRTWNGWILEAAISARAVLARAEGRGE